MMLNVAILLCLCFKMAVEFLHELNVPFFKVGSGDTNNFPYLKQTAQKGFHKVDMLVIRSQWLK